MLYKPNYCCSCGEKIDRVEWNLLTSRRFCEPCASEKLGYETVSRLVLAGGVLGVVFGLGSFWAGFSHDDRQAKVAVGLKGSAETQQNQLPTERKPDQQPAGELNNKPTVAPRTADPGVMAASTASEAKFFCRALTKKGTPCSRKVKARGTRCFQHEGRPEAPPTN
ncbi:MAG TPA: hypothetical protein VFZ49_05230 [Pyrinomonadaceae bacterium]